MIGTLYVAIWILTLCVTLWTFFEMVRMRKRMNEFFTWLELFTMEEFDDDDDDDDDEGESYVLKNWRKIRDVVEGSKGGSGDG